nr:MAG TPA: Terminase large subunit [Caudoviricetes sp.]
MINVIFKDFSYEILPKRLEIFEKYTKIIQWGRANPTRFIEDFFKIQLTDMQKYVLMSSWVPANCVWLMGRNSRKLLPLYQTVPVINEKDGIQEIVQKKIEDLKVGDTLIGSNGKPTKILQLHPVIYENIWNITLEDGQILEAGPEHLWTVYDFGRKTNLPKEEQMKTKYVYETQQLTYHTRLKPNKPEYRYGIPIAEPFVGEEKDFLIEPYLLGLWLGDGYKRRREIACDIKDIDEEINILESISKNGWIYTKVNLKETFGYIRISHKKDIEGYTAPKYFTECLKALNVYDNKHIPEEYFWGSFEQKLELLQGLMDSDGYCSKRGNAQFAQKDDNLAK